MPYYKYFKSEQGNLATKKKLTNFKTQMKSLFIYIYNLRIDTGFVAKNTNIAQTNTILVHDVSPCYWNVTETISDSANNTWPSRKLDWASMANEIPYIYNRGQSTLTINVALCVVRPCG